MWACCNKDDRTQQTYTLTHHRARGPHPEYPKRGAVSDRYVSWDTQPAHYAPVEFVHAAVLANDETKKPGGWAQPQVPPAPDAVRKRGSYEHDKRKSQFRFDNTLANPRPLNPRGRTGMQGRGLLGKWGPNFAADPVVTRYNPDKAGWPLEVVLIKRSDTGDWAIPGGMVDAGECVSVTLRREFTEEALAHEDAKLQRKCQRLVEQLFDDSNGVELYSGYVDDPRNTDNAWMETKAIHFHCSAEQAVHLRLKSGDDACDVAWEEVGEHNPVYCKLYANHKEFIDKVLTRLPLHAPDASRVEVGAPSS